MSDNGGDNSTDDIRRKSSQTEYNEELNNLSTQFFDDSSQNRINEPITELDSEMNPELNTDLSKYPITITNNNPTPEVTSENVDNELSSDSKPGIVDENSIIIDDQSNVNVTNDNITNEKKDDVSHNSSQPKNLPKDRAKVSPHDTIHTTDSINADLTKVSKDDGYTTNYNDNDDDNDMIIIPNKHFECRDKLPLENPTSIDKIIQHFNEELITLFSFYAYSQRGCSQQNINDKTMNQPELVKLLRDFHIYYPEVDLNRIVVSEIYDSCINKSLGIMELDFNRFCQCFIKCSSRAIYKKQYLKRFTTDIELSAALIWILEIENEQLTNLRLKGFPDLVEDDRPNPSDELIRDRLIILANDCEKPIDQYTPLHKLFPKFSLYGQENLNPNQLGLNNQQTIIQNDNTPWGIKERALQKLTLSKLEISKFQFPYQPSYHLPSNQSHRDVVSWDSFRGYSLDKQIQGQQKQNPKTSNDSTDKKKSKKEQPANQKPFSPPVMFPPISNPSNLNQQTINNNPIYQHNPNLQMGYQPNMNMNPNYPVQYNPVNNTLQQPPNIPYQSTIQPSQYANYNLPNNNNTLMNPSINPNINQTINPNTNTTIAPPHLKNTNLQHNTPGGVKPKSQDRYEIAKMNIERERQNRIQTKLATQNK